MKKTRFLILLFTITISAAVFSLISHDTFAATNCGSNAGGHDQSCGGDGSSKTRTCHNNSCNSVVYSKATGWEKVTVPASGQVYAPSLKYGGIDYAGGNIPTGNAAVGANYYLHAVYAAADGYVTLDGNRTYVTKGQFLTYIPVGGFPKADGSYDKAFAAAFLGGHSNGQYGALSDAQVRSIYNAMVAAGKISGDTQFMAEWLGFGGLDNPMALSQVELADLLQMLCDAGFCDTTDKPPVPVPSCHEGSHAGWTEGHAYVQNMTKGEGLQEGATTWARPGDTVRFAIDYCWGVGAVGGSLGNPSSPWAIYPGGHAVTKFGVVNEVWFAISAERNANYLFGENEKAISGGSNNKKNLLTNPHQSLIGNTGVDFSNNDVDATSDYAFVTMSPSMKGADQSKYNCQIFDFSPYWVDFGYQVPGVATGSCSAIANNGGNMSDVGHSISQTIRYNYATAWQMWKHIEDGVCVTGVCTHDPPGAVPYIVSHRIHADNDLNQLNEANTNVYTNEFPDLATARGTNGLWGLVWKHRGDTAMHMRDCDSSGCGCGGWHRWVINGCSYCTNRDEDGSCTNEEYYDCYVGCSGGDGCVCSGTNGKYFNYPTKNYSTAMQDLGERSSTATVNVPYSYRTNTESYIQANDYIYIGEDVSSNFTVDIIPRVVTEVRSDEAYATLVDGYISAVEFMVSADDPFNEGGLQGSNNAGSTDPCAWYQGVFGRNFISDGCKEVWHVDGPLNPEGRYMGITYNESKTRVVPDLERYPVGSKYCVAVGISTSDSHEDPENPTVSGMSHISGWRISGISCRTIVKKPNFQVWNGGLYTNGSITTSISEKNYAAELGDSYEPTRIFGSWEEYYVVAADDVVGFASGAALGYRGFNQTTLGLPGGAVVSSNYCDRSKMTISNSTCSNNYAGWSGVYTSMEVTKERIYSRYTDSGKGNGVHTLDNGATYVRYSGDTKISDLTNLSGAHSTPSNTEISANYIVQRKSTINADSEQTTSNYASNALVIHITGNLEIDRNICTGNGDCSVGNNGSRLILGNRNNDYYTNIYSLPQIIVIVEGDVTITQNVNQIDAWLVVGSRNGSGGGNIDTCKEFLRGTSGTEVCGNPIIFNGPIIADSISLNRTAGADPGYRDGSGQRTGRTESPANQALVQNLANDGSVSPGEIFNMRPDSLYWAFSQAQRFSQANVTYIRELAPRY